jgi:hypothetical protein
MEVIKSLFADKLMSDDREPAALFSIAPLWEPWKQVISVGEIHLPV